MTPQERDNLITQADFVARRFFRFYRYRYLSRSIDKDDLIQIARMKVLDTIEKYKDKPINELKKLINLRAGWEMVRVLQTEYNRYVALEKKPTVDEEETIPTEDIKYDADNEIYYEEEKEAEKEFGQEPYSFLSLKTDRSIVNMAQPTAMKTVPFFFEDLKTMLTATEYQIIYRYFAKGDTFQKIGDDLNYTKPRIYQLYKIALKKIKKELE